MLPALFTLLAMMLGMGVMSSIVPEESTDSLLPISAGVCLAAAAAATWVVGKKLNVTGPGQRHDAWYAGRRQQLDHLVQTGDFSLGPGQPRPRSFAEARQQADWLLDQESRRVREGTTDQHTLFWIPMQAFAFLIGLGAVVLVGIGITNLF